MSEGEKFELDRKEGMALDWRFLSANLANSSDGLVSMENSMNIIGSSSCSNSMVDSYGPNFLDLLPNSENLGFCDVNAHQSNVSSSITDGLRKDGFSFVRVGHDDNRTLGMSWNLNLASSMMMKTDGILPNGSLSQFPTDSGFIDAVRMSCFSAAGGFGDTMNSCGIPQSMALQALGGCSNEGDRGESSGDDGVGSHHDSQMLDCTSEEPSIKGLNPKKRKRKGQDNDSDKATRKGNCESRQKGEQQPTSTTKAASKKNAKQGSQASVPTDEGYVHVRARRGQATNSHSLAERVRREKISERMKFLQDLVPGCSKVTGKALMLDEIINYVQSLQQQAEFLSMKLASVNPHVDFNLEELLPKDVLQHRPGPSSVLGFLTEMPVTFPSSLHSPQPGLTRLTLPNMANSSNILERTVQQQGGFKEANQVNPLQGAKH